MPEWFISHWGWIAAGLWVVAVMVLWLGTRNAPMDPEEGPDI